MAIQKVKKYIADRDCVYKGRFVKSGTVIEVPDEVEFNHAAFAPYSEKERTTPVLFDPTQNIATQLKTARATAGIVQG